MKIQIYNCYHAPSPLIGNEVVTPIQLGKAAGKVDLGILGDDTGDNISKLNPYYCELTALYWAWKNASADVIGLFHYRRLLDLRAINNAEPVVKFHKFRPSLLADYGITPGNIAKQLEYADFLLPRQPPSKITLYERWGEYPEDLDLTLELIKQKYPEMGDFAYKVIHEQHCGYFYNLFIARKKSADEYAAFMFDILFDLQGRIHQQVLSRSAYEQRIYGFVAEMLTTIYLEYGKATNRFKVKEYPLLFLESSGWKFFKYRTKKCRYGILALLGLGPYAGQQKTAK